jgi:sulfotransferase famil protein
MLKSDLTGENLFYRATGSRFVYIANYKAAYTSTLTTLIDVFPDLRAALWESGLPAADDLRDAFVFTFVRDPVDRVRSCYFDKIVVSPDNALAQSEVPGPQDCQITVYEACVRHLDRSAPPRPSHRQVLERLRRLSFGEFVSLLPHICLKDVHFYPQSRWLDKFPTLRPRCFVGRVETMARDWQTVNEHMDGAVPLLHENRTDYAATQAEAPLDDRSRHTIDQVYAADYRDFYPTLAPA